MKHEIVLSGVGGQGLVSTGEIMAIAASLYEEDLFATMTASYGSETRGTFTKTDVILSDRPIGYPNVDVPEIILCLAQVAYDKYAPRFTDGTLVFYDSEQVTPSAGARGTHVGHPFRSMSLELGNLQVANTIALGVIMKRCALLHRDSVVKAIETRFEGKETAIALNVRALDFGLGL